MGRRWAGLALFLLAGCTDAEDVAPDLAGPSLVTSCADACPSDGVQAPDLAVGTYWHYQGRGAFDIEKEFTVVVARADASGYLFAAAEEAQLDSLVTWPRVWYGERDRNLNPPYPYGEQPGLEMLFDFPLRDGKTWTAWPEGPNVTARAANITTPAGAMPGFSIQGQLEDLKVEWDYVPALGTFTRYSTGRSVRTHDLQLIESGNGSSWVWYEEGPAASVFWDDPADSSPYATLTVPQGFDAVAGLAYGRGGARGGILRPGVGAQPWTFEAGGCCASADDWTTVNLPAAAGDWQLYMTSTAPGMWGEIDLMAVRWLRPA